MHPELRPPDSPQAHQNHQNPAPVARSLAKPAEPTPEPWAWERAFEGAFEPQCWAYSTFSV